MLEALVGLAGVAFSAVGVSHDILSRRKDAAAWQEEDRWVDNEWLDLAISKGALPGNATDYAWPLAARVGG